MSEIIYTNASLPTTIDDLSRFVLVGREKLVSVRAEIRAIEKVGLAQEVREQKLREAQDISEAVLDAEVRIGELMAKVPKAGGTRTDIEPRIEQIYAIEDNNYIFKSTMDNTPQYSYMTTDEFGFTIYTVDNASFVIIPKDENTLYIFITQSGETSDTLKAVERVKAESNLPTLCVTNVENSTIWKTCDYQVACHAGVEKGIAATKSFTAQMLCLILVSLKLIENINSDDTSKELLNSLFDLSNVIEKTLEKREVIKKVAKHLSKEKLIVLTAEGISYSLAKEGALKIKETSYKNISASILGEFMHGHVAVLNNKGTLIFISAGKISERAINNLNNIKRDYKSTIIIIGDNDSRVKSDYNIDIECKNELQQYFANVVVLQILALEIALKLKRNVDSPKGLHKIVVEKTI